MNEESPCFLECKLKLRGRAIGTTTREAFAVRVAGRALLGETTFPVWKPKLNPGERVAWLRGGWVIVARGE